MSETTYIGVVRDGKIELANPVPWPEGSQVSITISVLIDEQMARRKVNRWLMEHIGNMVMAGEAKLVREDNETIWQFEALVTSPSHPPIGPIGYVEIQANTGEISSDEKVIKTMIEYGQNLAGASLPTEG